MPLAAALHREISAALAQSSRRVLQFPVGSETAWIKRPRRGPGYTVYSLQAGAATLLGMPLLWPPRVSRGARGLRGEARRLTRLQRKGWPVPQVLDVTDGWLALRDNGTSLAPVVRNLQPRQRAALLRSALAFLQSLHAQGGWHGAGQLRNFTQLGTGFGLIDFEDDLEPTMPLAQRQARDVALFLLSAARFGHADPTLIDTLMTDAHARASPEVDAELCAQGRKLAALRGILGPIAARTGVEGRAMAALGESYARLAPLAADGHIEVVRIHHSLKR